MKSLLKTPATQMKLRMLEPVKTLKWMAKRRVKRKVKRKAKRRVKMKMKKVTTIRSITMKSIMTRRTRKKQRRRKRRTTTTKLKTRSQRRSSP